MKAPKFTVWRDGSTADVDCNWSDGSPVAPSACFYGKDARLPKATLIAKTKRLWKSEFGTTFDSSGLPKNEHFN